MVDSEAKTCDLVTMIHAFTTRRRGIIVRDCLDMLASGKINDLRIMWVVRPGVEIKHVYNSFCRILLLMTNIDIEGVFGLVEAIGVWPTISADLYEAAMTGSVSIFILCFHMS